MLSPALPTVWDSVAGVCPRDAGLFPEADAPSVACRQPRLCVGYSKEPWRATEKAAGAPGPQKMGEMLPQETCFVLQVPIWVDLRERHYGSKAIPGLGFHIQTKWYGPGSLSE